MQRDKNIVISLGGSLIVPGDIDTVFVKDFVELVSVYAKENFHFVIITGGGKICRKYNEALEKIITPSHEDLDWLGIAITRANAEFVRIAFGDLADEKISLDPDHLEKKEKPIKVGGGWQPGNSSDLAAVRSAKSVGAKKVINLSNIDYAYDKDPKVFPDAKKIEQTSWADFRAILPTEWDPGLNAPFDPIAAREASELDLEVAIMNGKNIDNLKNYLDGKPFIGTVIT